METTSSSKQNLVVNVFPSRVWRFSHFTTYESENPIYNVSMTTIKTASTSFVRNIN
ncbi:hypothetical protein JHK86_017022 [Glycine max]|nr:hypothetical protein JHK86_017022 [Glycine max]